ncbi:MAG: membrane protein insertase YidC [Rhodanobacteraceae bacterium]
MNNPRNLLLLALLFLGYLLWVQWQQDFHPSAQSAAAKSEVAQRGTAAATQAAATQKSSSPEIPTASGPTANPSGSTPAASNDNQGTPPPAPSPIVVTTDVLRVEISPVGGTIVSAALLAYPTKPRDYADPVRLLDSQPDKFFVAQTGLVSSDAEAPSHQAMMHATRLSYGLAAGSDSIEVPLTWTDSAGLSVRKVFSFKRGSYVINERQEIANASSKEWIGNAYRQLQRVPPVLQTSGIKGYANTARYSFVGAAWYSRENKFEKLKFAKFKDDPLSKDFSGGWAAMLQHYFFAAWIPPNDEVDHYSTAMVQADDQARYLIRAVSPPITVAPGAHAATSARLYVGPKLQGTLDQVAPGLALTVDYGIFTVISEPLHWILSLFHKLTGNWGFAIILLVLLIKAVFFKLSEAQYRSMAKMRKMQPRIKALKDRYGDDRQKVNAAMMELYKKEKINPLGGCLPMLVQIPVFFALYWVLLESVELRQAPFILWIHNLTAPDPYYVLPALNALAMLATQWLTPNAGMDPMQAKMMKIMPLAFSVMFAFFPAGLVLYWTVNGTLSLAQQWIITKRIDAGQKA